MSQGDEKEQEKEENQNIPESRARQTHQDVLSIYDF